jgi:hypothetical protein
MNHRITENIEIKSLSPGFVFFLQRMDELLFDFTIDTYKPMALNTPYLCIELLKTIKDVKVNNIDKANIKYILDELRSSLKSDFVSKELILKNYDYYLNWTDHEHNDTLRKKIEIQERSLDRYRYSKKIKELLHKKIIENSKDKIDYLTRNLITTYINWGVSKQYLYSVFNHFFYNSQRIFEDNQILEFYKLLEPVSHSFTVYFKVSKNFERLKDSYKFFNISIPVIESEPLQNKLDSIRLRRGRDSLIIGIKNIHTFDPFSARQIAERRLETIKNTTQLFYHNSSFRWAPKAISIQTCCSDIITETKRSINPMISAFNFKAEQVSDKTNRVFKHTALRGESFTKFNRAIELHSNSVHYLKPENQIVNMWTILETIIPSDYSKSKIQIITDFILPVVCFNYYGLIIFNLYSDIKRWDITRLYNLLDVEDETSDNYRKLVDVLCNPEKDSDIDEFYNFLESFHLLRNRIFKIREILRSKEKLLSNLERHSNNVIWQIRRIYRTRNLIVHSGRSVSYINTLIINAHDYIDQVITEVINLSTSSFRVSTLEQSFGVSQLKYKNFQDSLSKSTNYTDYIDLLIEPIESNK